MHDSTGVEENFVPVDLLATPNYLSSKKHSININRNRILVILILIPLIVTVLGLITGLLVPRRKLHEISSSECFEAACPESWIGFQRKCFYFSDDIKNWTFSQRFCDSYGADLVQIETLLELNFLLRYKGPYDHWIGLSRDLGQPWKWVNGTEWPNCFPIRGGGECAYLNDKGASSARHYTERKWICSKPDIYAQMKRQTLSDLQSHRKRQKT
ncbi:C-type lectin domain family 2 member D isoform X2 [Vulpes vulpes]|uniref:C-type lectin domain family 2 member D isoform X2 n=1 Tax=Vulpes vulpes TaxID=9627 RepID=A0A3Q7RXD4_VULVU|nr:C-type lectin domain family 2 member D [Vulpes vulpes]XP_041591270.1 C-type lectin domain family 2 member D [Vulpes lagopus]